MSELESRLAAVESWVGHADLDLSDLKNLLRAQTSLMQALRIEQVAMNHVLGEQGVALGALVFHATETNKRLGEIDETLATHGGKLEDHDRRFDGIDRRFDGIDRRFDGIDRRFDGIDQRLEEILRRLPSAS